MEKPLTTSRIIDWDILAQLNLITKVERVVYEADERTMIISSIVDVVLQ